MTRRKIRYDPTDDFYAVLGVQPSATTDELHRAFRQRAKQVHPDLNPDNLEWAHAEFQRVNDAHDILTDPTLRGEYDSKRRTALLGEPKVTTPRRATTLSEASRMAWAHRRRSRRRNYSSVFFVAALLFVVSCWMLQFPERWNSVQATSTSGGDSEITPVSASGESTPPLAPHYSPALVVPDCSNRDATIAEPQNGTRVDRRFSVRGTAAGPNFRDYSLLVGVHRADQILWLPLMVGVRQPVNNGVLFPAGVTDLLLVASAVNLQSDFTLRLIVDLNNGRSLPPCDVSFQFDEAATPPVT